MECIAKQNGKTYDEFLKERSKGSAKVRTSDEELEKIREEVAREYAKKFNIKLD